MPIQNHCFELPRRVSRWNGLRDLLKKNALNITLALLTLYVFYSGQLQISIQIGNGRQANANMSLWPSVVADKTTNLPQTQVKLPRSGHSDLASEVGKPIGVAEINSQPKVTSTTGNDANLANNYNNLTFLVDPTYAKRKQVPAEIVRQKREKCLSYVQKYAAIAQAEKDKFGIPASIILAQGLLESNVGESRLTQRNQNHFGIKCFSRHCKTGHCSNFTDDTHKDFFRKYKSAWESFREHSQFLQQSRYAKLKKLSHRDYRNWAFGLKSCGYATDPRYAQKLVAIIEGLQLNRFDEEAK